MSLEHFPARNGEYARRLNTTEAAEYLGLSKSTMDKLRVFGGGPRYLKLTARRVVYDTRDLDLFLQSRTRNNTSEAE